MIDAKLLPLQRAVLRTPAALAANAGIGADTISIIGFLIGVAAFASLSLGNFMLGLLLIIANRTFDGMDGAVARISGPTDRGAYLDISLDFVFYALVPLGFAIAQPSTNALPAAVLIASFVGTGSSFLALSAIASRLGRRADAFPAKGIYYAGGLAEGFETIAVFVSFCLFPSLFAPIAYGFAAICAVTTVLRWRQGWVMIGAWQQDMSGADAHRPNGQRQHDTV
jgi:phosphatidylglycerophosphate synthase